MTVVDPEVTRVKFERELGLWRKNEETYRRRGWILLGRREFEVDVGFLGRVPLGANVIPAMTACVRLDFTNYDVWPPSVEFINPFTGEYAAPPVQALVESDEGHGIWSSRATRRRTGPSSVCPGYVSTTTIRSTPVTPGFSIAEAAKGAWQPSVIASGGRWRETWLGCRSGCWRCRGRPSFSFRS